MVELDAVVSPDSPKLISLFLERLDQREIDDSRAAALGKLPDMFEFFGIGPDLRGCEVEVRPVNSFGKQLQLFFIQLKNIPDVFPYLEGGCSGKGDRLGEVQDLSEVANLAVGWSEVMAPLGDAVSLIDCEELDSSGDFFESLSEFPLVHSFRGGVNQLIFPACESLVALCSGLTIEC